MNIPVPQFATPFEAQKFLIDDCGLSHAEAAQLTESRDKFEFYLRTLFHMAHP